MRQHLVEEYKTVQLRPARGIEAPNVERCLRPPDTPNETHIPPGASMPITSPSIFPPTDSRMRWYVPKAPALSASSPIAISCAPASRTSLSCSSRRNEGHHPGAGEARELDREVAGPTGGAGDQHASTEQAATLLQGT